MLYDVFVPNSIVRICEGTLHLDLIGHPVSAMGVIRIMPFASILISTTITLSLQTVNIMKPLRDLRSGINLLGKNCIALTQSSPSWSGRAIPPIGSLWNICNLAFLYVQSISPFNLACLPDTTSTRSEKSSSKHAYAIKLKSQTDGFFPISFTEISYNSRLRTWLRWIQSGLPRF